MTFLDIITDVETISNVTSQRVLVKRSVNHALERVFSYFDWPYYIQEGALATVATYTTGTAKVTNGSTAVTGVGTSWTAAHIGRKFRHSNEKAYYRIKTVTNATSLTLEQSYQGSTDSTGSSYTIYKDEYRLAEDTDKYKLLRQIQNGIPIFSFHPSKFDEIYPTPQSYSDPIFEILSGTKLDTYTVGTISGTAGSSIIYGASTLWTTLGEGIGRLTKIRKGNYVYTVKSLDSATQITIYETLSENITAGSAYEITLNNLVIQLYQIPDNARLIYYRYFRVPTPLYNDYDIPDMPHAWHWLLMYGALSIILMQKGDINKAQQEAEARFIQGLEQMKMKIGSFTPDRIWKRKSTDRRRRISEGLESSAFDIRYSSPA